MLTYGVLAGTGNALLNTPAYACIGHFFSRRRGLATGIATTSGAVGGIVIPILLQNLLPRIGFAWSARVLGFLLLAMAIPANLFLRTRLPPDKDASAVLPDFSAFKNRSFALCMVGMFMLELGLFVPLAYISSYATSHGQRASFGFTAVALLNAGSFFGRFVPGFAADRMGRFNVIVLTIALCIVTILGVWLPAGSSKAAIIVFALTFGFASGSNLGLVTVCLSQLCPIEKYGRYISTAWFCSSFG